MYIQYVLKDIILLYVYGMCTLYQSCVYAYSSNKRTNVSDGNKKQNIWTFSKNSDSMENKVRTVQEYKCIKSE